MARKLKATGDDGFPKDTHSRRRRVCILLADVLLLVALTMLPWFKQLDAMVADALYQTKGGPDPRVYVIGIDAYALDEIGAWPWSRTVMAQVVETLNADPALRPAAIGLDVVYSGDTDPQADAALANAAAAGNVVVAAMAEYGTRMVEEGGREYLSDFAVTALSMPFDRLAAAAPVGHINAMYDGDGVLRHHLWQVRLPQGGALSSMPQLLYQMYCRAHGLPGDFEPRTDANGFWWLDYSAGPGGYYAYSVQDILTGEYDPDLLAGQIVLIGPYDTGLSDDFVTAADRAERMYGAEYLANVTAALLAENDPLEVPDAVQYALFCGLCMLCGLLFYNVRLRFAAPAYIGFFAASLLGVQACYGQGLVFCPLWLPTSLTLLFIGSVAERYYVASREHRFIMDTFEHYVDPSVLQELLRESRTELGLGGKTRVIAVLFVDIRGFTSLSEKMEPEKVVAVLNEYLTLTSQCIRGNRGTLDKFIGDCTMAIWGAPLRCDDPVWHACKAAMDMVRLSRQLEDSLRAQYGAEIRFGVGIHYGPAVVGNIGAPERLDYTAIGDTVNTASRLEANAPPGKIYISRRVADILGGCARVTSLGTSVKLKGKAKEFEVLELEELRPREGDHGPGADQP